MPCPSKVGRFRVVLYLQMHRLPEVEHEPKITKMENWAPKLNGQDEEQVSMHKPQALPLTLPGKPRM